MDEREESTYSNVEKLSERFKEGKREARIIPGLQEIISAAPHNTSSAGRYRYDAKEGRLTVHGKVSLTARLVFKDDDTENRVSIIRQAFKESFNFPVKIRKVDDHTYRVTGSSEPRRFWNMLERIAEANNVPTNKWVGAVRHTSARSDVPER